MDEDPTIPNVKISTPKAPAERPDSQPSARPQGGWVRLTTEQRYENPWISVIHHDVTTPGGRPGVYGVVRFHNAAVGVVPVDQSGDTWLVGQYRFPLDRYSWEIPEGGAPEGETTKIAAQRELAEETGLNASHWLRLGQLDLSNSVTDEQATFYVAWGLSLGDMAPEDTECLSVQRLPLRDAVAMALDGRITDAISVAALLKLALMDRIGGLPSDLAPLVRLGLGTESSEGKTDK